MKKVNLLAPAGNWESLTVAVNAGAQEIYFGVGELNMRSAGANNFSINDLEKIGEIAKKNKIKSWLTLNTVVYDEEIGEVEKILKAAKKARIDGVIASDWSVIKMAKKEKLAVCVSTQMSVSNLETVKMLTPWVERIVLARELNLEQIKKITQGIKKEKLKVEIEVFGHGAMCVAVAGRCQMSLYHHNLGANRGKCVQMCRRKYKVKDLDSGKEMILENNLIMSRSDLCTIGLLDKLVESGISTIKIEGRARGADYVDTVVGVYKKALKLIEEKKYDEKEKEKLMEELKTVFNRGFSSGYYLGRTIDEWTKGENNLATESKKLIGKVEHFYPKIGVAEIKMEEDKRIQNGDNYIIIGPSTGVVRGEFLGIKWEGKTVTFGVKEKVRKNDKVFLVVKK